jgi:DNA-binding NtrC family response regulator
MDFLESFTWPGNVRQLRNVIENMVVLARSDTLTVENLPASLEVDPLIESGRIQSGATSLVALQRSAVEKALVECNGHRTRAAESLGISVRTLQRKLKAWGLEKSAGPPEREFHAAHSGNGH